MEGAVLLEMLYTHTGLGCPQSAPGSRSFPKASFAEDVHLHFIKSAVCCLQRLRTALVSGLWVWQ